METIWIVLENGLLLARPQGAAWAAESRLEGRRTRCLAVDPRHPERLYCGTLDHGLWRSLDNGESWEPAGHGMDSSRIMAVAASPVEHADGLAVVYAGTEPSAVYRSADGGDSWQRCRGLNDLPSSTSWSFPPRPDTHHVRCITLDPHQPRRLWVCIEAGALVSSLDGGATWRDRQPNSPRDTHTLVVHPALPGQLYAAAGDGYAESDDGGDEWRWPEAGLRDGYAWSVAVDPTDPDMLVLSAAPGPYQAHNSSAAESRVYRRAGSEPWEPAMEGLPPARGTTRSVLAADPSEPGCFYAANNHGLYRSAAGGRRWESVPVPWPAAYRGKNVEGLVIVPRGVEPATSGG